MRPPPTISEQAIAEIVRGEWGRLLSSLIGTLRDFQLAEDCLQDALESALVHWARGGLPRAPSGWLLQTARRKAIDRIRRDKNFERKSSEYALLIGMEEREPDLATESAIPDERLRLIFTCCHPALDEKTWCALTLRTLGGLTTREIARAFLDTEETMAQRLVRAKQKIARAAIPYEIPDATLLPERLASVLNVLYLIFNEGYAASAADAHIRRELCDEAIRLTRVLLLLWPGDPEVMGLLALMLLHDSRRIARVDAQGEMAPLEYQDRTLWLRPQIAEGVSLVEQALRCGAPGPFQLQAAISALHAEAPSFLETDWREIAGLYDLLYRSQANDVVRLNYAVACSFAGQTHQALDELAALETILDRYQPYHAALADCLRRTGRHGEAKVAYARAIELSASPRERAFLARRANSLDIPEP